MRPEVTGFFDEATNTISYVAVEPATRKSAVVDSMLDFDPSSGRTDRRSANQIIDLARKGRPRGRADPRDACPRRSPRRRAYKQELGGRLAMGSEITTVQNAYGKIFNARTGFQRDGSQFDVLSKDGDTFQAGSIPARAMHTPSHPPSRHDRRDRRGCVRGRQAVMPDAGAARADFPGGDARKLFRSTRGAF